MRNRLQKQWHCIYQTKNNVHFDFLVRNTKLTSNRNADVTVETIFSYSQHRRPCKHNCNTFLQIWLQQSAVPLENPLIEITIAIILQHGREQFSSSIHSAVYVNHLSGAEGHREWGGFNRERRAKSASTLIIVMETIEPPPPTLERRAASTSISSVPCIRIKKISSCRCSLR
jgi:hypothetical protein